MAILSEAQMKRRMERDKKQYDLIKKKTEIQKKGVGGGGIFIYVLFYYNSRRWSKGMGVLGCPLCLAFPCLASRSLLTFPALHP